MPNRLALALLLLSPFSAVGQTPDWNKINEEAMRHFQALVRLDTTDPPGNETRVVEYVKKVLDAEICLAEGGGVRRKGGKTLYGTIQTTEKQPRAAQLIAKGPAGHGSRPLRSNAVVHLSRAIEKIAMWDPPTRFNDTTRNYFEK